MSVSIPESSVPPGGVGRAGDWAVAQRRDGSLRAVSSRCRHQLADLSKGSLDKNGCLVCPWHGSRYDLDTGAMVEGPKGFLWYVGKTPGYTQMIRAYGAVLKLRTRAVERRDGDLVVGDR
ncbi:MAG: Rieske (2Fe-2S) iron-sulfur domain protein [Frankiales bacterium]|jgi:nitrite reductase/ring-hydroxylating ferredoxin subunit|nr:Rieske (2Fe-2S) iron-sulfur domain protein [Frankiales bacterium]